MTASAALGALCFRPIEGFTAPGSRSWFHAAAVNGARSRGRRLLCTEMRAPEDDSAEMVSRRDMLKKARTAAWCAGAGGGEKISRLTGEEMGLVSFHLNSLIWGYSSLSIR